MNKIINITLLSITTLVLGFVVMNVAMFVTDSVNTTFAYESDGGYGSDGCCGGEGGDGGYDNGGGYETPVCTDPAALNTNQPLPCNYPQPPTCDFLNADKVTLPYGGGDVTLKWGTTRADTVTLTPDGSTVADDNSAGKVVHVTEDVTFVINAINAVSSDSCQVSIDVGDPIAKPPSCDFFTATPTTLPVGGGDTVLTWGTTNADSVSINQNIGVVNADNATGRTEHVTVDTAYTMTVSAAGYADVTCPAKVVVEKATPAPTCDFFTAAPKTLPIGGGNTVLTWATTNADSVSINQNIGVVNADNATGRTEHVTTDTTYIMTVSAAGHADVTCPASVIVEKATPAPQCKVFTASPGTHPVGGGVSTLTWEAINADSITIDNGVLASTNVLKGATDVNVTQSITYTMTVSAAGHADVICPAPITVADPGVFSCASNVTFTASDKALTKGGGNVDFTWNVTNADDVSISGLSSTAHAGSESVNVTSNKTFTLIATKAGYTSLSCPISVTVATGGGGGGSSSPRCELDISEEKITLGDEVTLEWDTTRAKDVKITDNHGNVLLDSDDKDDFDGKMTIKPTEDTEYTLLSKRGSKERKCRVEVELENKITVFETRTHDPRVAGISLTQVPYTGFEAGPTLTFIFYALLTIWGLFVAYIFVIRRDSVGGVSFAGAHEHVAFTDVSTDQVAEETEVVTEAESYVYAATETEAPANLPIAPVAKVVGYSSLVTESTDEEADTSIEMTEIENRAHAQNILLSSDAMRFFMNATEAGEVRNAKLDAAILKAKASFPSEGGWIALNLARIETLITDDAAEAKVETQTEPISGGSLAEAIVEGNVVAAYELIAHRPMIALADAAAELDAVYRSRKGETVQVSNMLASATVSNEQLEAAITALTGALDGTYDSEESAVKMAIMKAVKATS